MRRAGTSAVVLLLIAFAAGPSPASEPAAGAGLPPPLFALDADALAARAGAAPGAQKGLVLPDSAEEFPIQADPAAVLADPPAFTVELPDLPLLEAVRSRFVDHGPDWKSWIGTLRVAGGGGSAGPGSGYVHLGYHGDRLTGLLQFEGRHFRIAGTPGGHLLARLSEDRSPLPCGVADGGAALPLPAEPEAGAAPPGDRTGAAATAPHRIDVLALYPRGLFVSGPDAVAELVRFVRDSIALANDVFVRSHVPAEYRLAGVVPLIGADQPLDRIGRALTWLQTQPAEMAALRNAYGADVVALYVPFSWTFPDVCGFAVLPDAATGSMRDSAFSVNRAGCGVADFTLAHEIGHNYGMRHDDDDDPEGALFPHGRGNVITLGGQRRATLMGCACTGCACDRSCALGSAAICNRIPYLADPQLLVEGVPTGTAGRNDARVARLQTPVYAAFRAPAANTPPAADFTVSCRRLTCTFEARASDASAVTSYWWDFGDGETASGATATHMYREGGPFPVHLVVTDDGPHGGQRGVEAGVAQPSAAPPRYQGVLQNVTCTAVTGWAWDQDFPDTPITVTITRDGAPPVTVLADRFRPGLANAGKGDGRHGFVLPIPAAWKDGTPQVVRARFENLGSNLAESPRLLQCGISAFAFRNPAASRNLGGAAQTVASQISSSLAGAVTHLGYYRVQGERGAHTGRLWSDTGTLLAQVAFPRLPPTAPSGWVWQPLPAPVQIAAHTRYRVAVNTNTVQARAECLLRSRFTHYMLTVHGSFTAPGANAFPSQDTCDAFFVDVRFDPR